MFKITYLGLMKTGRRVPHAWVRINYRGNTATRFVREGARLGSYEVHDFTTEQLILNNANANGDDQKAISFKDTEEIKLK